MNRDNYKYKRPIQQLTKKFKKGIEFIKNKTFLLKLQIEEGRKV